MIQALSCPKCCGNITVFPNLTEFNCGYCGTAILVNRGEGYVALQLAEKVTQAIEQQGQQTQEQMRRVELNQKLTTAQLQLSNVQQEIRTLERLKQTSQVKGQLRGLRQHEYKLRQYIVEVHRALNPDQQIADAVPPKPPSRFLPGCILAIVVYVVVGIVLTNIGKGMDNAFHSGGIATMGTITALCIAIFAFWWHVAPNARKSLSQSTAAQRVKELWSASTSGKFSVLLGAGAIMLIIGLCCVGVGVTIAPRSTASETTRSPQSIRLEATTARPSNSSDDKPTATAKAVYTVEYSTSTTIPTEVVPTAAPVVSTDAPVNSDADAPCSCAGDTLNCSDFSGHSAAQACFEYCKSQGRGDIHNLDHDGDGSVCEN